MTRIVHSSPSVTCTLTRPDGSTVAEGTYSDLRMEVEDEIHGGDEPIPFTVTKGIFLAIDEVGSPEVASILERMAEEVHADLKLRFEVVMDAVFHVLDHPEDRDWLIGGVEQAFNLVDDPTATMADLRDLKMSKGAVRTKAEPVDQRVVRDLVSLLLRATRPNGLTAEQREATRDFLERKGLMPIPLREGGAA